MERKLYRDQNRKVIAGVCAGLAEYFNIDVTLVRLLFVLTLIYHGGGTLAYIVLWIVMPRKIVADNEPIVDYTVHNENTAFNPQKPWEKYRNLNTNKDVAQIGGAVLILLGLFFLLDQFDFIPYWLNFEQFWPVILVVIGLWLVFRSKPNQTEQKVPPLHKEEWTDINPNNDAPKNI